MEMRSKSPPGIIGFQTLISLVEFWFVYKTNVIIVVGPVTLITSDNNKDFKRCLSHAVFMVSISSQIYVYFYYYLTMEYFEQCTTSVRRHCS